MAASFVYLSVCVCVCLCIRVFKLVNTFLYLCNAKFNCNQTWVIGTMGQPKYKL